MRHRLFLLFSLLIPFSGMGQTDTVPAPLVLPQGVNISLCRLALLDAFERDDRLETQYWLDSLRRLEDDGYLALYWDERWLLYLWLENYAPLLSEVARHNSAVEELAVYKMSPVKDSLFERLDTRMYEERLVLFDQVRKGWLTAEERAFTSLLVTYLLRLSVEDHEKKDFDAQLDAFLKTFPTSRFVEFIRRKMYNNPQPDDWGVGLDLLFLQGNWSGDIERSLRTLYGVDMAFYVTKKRFNTLVRFAVGTQKLARPVRHRGFDWPEDDRSSFLSGDLELGYDIIHKPRLRVFPTVGGGYSAVRPPANDEVDLPDFYDLFRFNGWHYQVALHTDLKFNMGGNNVAGSYHGVRIRAGHRWLHLDKGNPAMRGNMFFFAVGYTLFGRQALH